MTRFAPVLLLLACNGDGLNTEFDDTGTTGDDTGGAEDHGAVTGVGITPFNPTVDPNGQVQLRAEATYEDGFAETLYSGVSWTSSDTRVANIDSSGVAFAQESGTSDITARTDGGDEATVTLTVTGAGVTLTSVVVSPGTHAMLVGENVQLAATGQYSDGTEGNVSGSCDWVSSDDSVARVTGEGKVTGTSVGEVTVDADCDGQTDSATVTVEEDDFVFPEPDLEIASFAGAELPGGDIEYTAEVRNAGNGYSSAFWVQLFLDESGPPTDVNGDDAFSWIPGLGAGETVDVVLDVFDPGAGTYSSWLVVDMLEQVDESDEGNNVDGPVSVTVAPAGSLPDLQITYFDGFSDTFDTLYSFTVENTGGQATGQFYIDLWYNPSAIPEAGPSTLGDDYISVPGLLPGETFDWDPETTGGPGFTGEWWSCLLVDSNADVDESDEDNNVDCYDVEVF